MKEADKKPVQSQPLDNNSQPVVQNTPADKQQEHVQPDEEQNNGDYAIVGSGLGIDE